MAGPHMGAGHLSFDLEMMVSGAINPNQNPRFFFKKTNENEGFEGWDFD